MLWFDVEEKGNTTMYTVAEQEGVLWFDVEEKGNTTLCFNDYNANSCGLM